MIIIHGGIKKLLKLMFTVISHLIHSVYLSNHDAAHEKGGLSDLPTSESQNVGHPTLE